MSNDTALTPELLDVALAEWDSLAFFAYDQFTRKGRGAVGLERDPESERRGSLPVRALYAIFPSGSDQPDAKTASLLAAYEPDEEFVVMFVQSTGGIRTLRLRTAPDARSPKLNWFCEMLRRLSEEPESIPEQLPGWFLDSIGKLQTMLKTNDRNG